MITTALEGLQERRLGSCGKPLFCRSGDFPELVRPRKDFLFKDQEKSGTNSEESETNSEESGTNSEDSE